MYSNNLNNLFEKSLMFNYREIIELVVKNKKNDFWVFKAGFNVSFSPSKLSSIMP